jgi:hypothetical protein
MPTGGACPFRHGSRGGARLAFGSAPRAPSLASSRVRLREVAPLALERVLLAPSPGLDPPALTLDCNSSCGPPVPPHPSPSTCLWDGWIPDLRAYSQNIP